MRYCCVPQCTGRGGYLFPVDKSLRAKWIVAVRREGLLITNNTSVCPAHFKDEDFKSGLNFQGQQRKYRRLLPSAVPSVFFWSRPQTESAVSRRCRAARRLAFKDASLLSVSADSTAAVESEYDSVITPTESDQNVFSMDVAETVDVELTDPLELSVCTQTEVIATTDTFMQTESADCPRIPVISVPVLSIENLRNDGALLHYYTGLETLDKLMTVYFSLGPGVNFLQYYRTQTVNNISTINQFILMLAKLRQDLDYLPLSRLCGVSEFTAQNVFITLVNFCSRQWSEINLWLQKDLVQYYMPADFRAKFPTTRLIVDGTEVPIKKPSKPVAQRATFSSYKNRNTVKVVVGTTPAGLVSYLSPAYGGSTSDRQIIERSGLPSMCDSHDSVMADKGFNVQDLFVANGVSVNIPTFFKKKNRLTSSQVLADRKIASKRVHIERVIGLMKTYKILTSPLPPSETVLSSHIFKICAMLCNFRSCIIGAKA